MSNRFQISTIKSERKSSMGFGAKLVDCVTGLRHPLHRLVSDGHGSYAPCGFDTMQQAQVAAAQKAAQILRAES